MIGEIVDIDSQHHSGALSFGDGCDHVHEFGFAVITTIEIVGAVRGPFHLGGVDRRPPQVPFVGQKSALAFFFAGQAG